MRVRTYMNMTCPRGFPLSEHPPVVLLDLGCGLVRSLRGAREQLIRMCFDKSLEV